MAVSAGSIFLELQVDDSGMVTGIKRAGGALQSFQTTLNQTTAAAARMDTSTESMGTKFRNLVVTLGNLRFVAMDVHDVFMRLPMAILKSAGELERLQTTMKGLSKELTEIGRNTDAKNSFNFVTEFAKKAPFEISAVSDSFVKLKTAGIDPTNGSMKALVDSVAAFGGNSETLKRASVAIQQMAGKGVISMEELRQQLGEAVPTAMQQMADGMGVSMSKLAAIVKTGTLEAGPAINKMFVQMKIDNEGAAAEMMKTWGGALSQFKTEWELSAKFIADSGFGDAAKTALAQITEVLKSDEFRRFAVDVGNGLKELVQNVMAIGTAMIKYREVIMSVGEAWLAYKVVTSAIIPLAKAINKGYDDGVASIEKNVGSLTRKVDIERAMNLQSAAAAVRQAELEEMALAKKLARDTAELESVRIRNAAILAEETRQRVALDMLENRAFVAGLNSQKQRDEHRASIEMLGQKNTELNARQIELTRSVEAGATAHRTAQEATARTVTAQAQLTSQTNLSRYATIAAEGATKAWGATLNLMGGWIGVTITALTALAYWYNKVAQEAEDSAQRRIRAESGVSDAKDLAAEKEVLADAQAKLRAAQREGASSMAFGPDGSPRKKTADEAAADAAAIESAANLVAETKKRLGLMQTNVDEALARQQSTAFGVQQERRLTAISNETRTEINALEKAKREKLDGVKKDSEEYQAIVNDFNKQKQNAFVRGLEKRISEEQKAITEAAAKSAAAEKGSAEYNAQKMIETEREKAKAQLESELKFTRDSIDADAPYGGKKGKKPPVSSLQKLTEKFGAERARLEAELTGFNGVAQKADKIAGVIAELRAKLQQGKLTDENGKKITSEANPAYQAMLGDAVAVAALKENLARDKELASEMKAVTSYIETMRPEVEQAMELLANPLEKVTRGPAEGKTEKWIAKNTQAIEAYASKMGETVEEVKSKIRGDAMSIDIASEFSKIAQETEKMNATLVTDTKKAAAAKTKYESEQAVGRMDRLISYARAHGATEEQITQMTKTQEDFRAAGAAKLAQDMKTPLQKLADDWADTTTQMNNATAKWANSGVDLMMNFVTTGKFEFGKFAESIINDLIKIQLQKSMAGAMTGGASFLSSILPFADGGIMSAGGSLPLKKYAAGGIATSPQMAIFGEGSMNEAYVPLPDGRSIPVTMTGGGAQPAPVTVNLIESPGNGGQVNQRSENGSNVIDVMVEKIGNKIAGQISQGSGPVTNALQTTYGLNRVAGAY